MSEQRDAAGGKQQPQCHRYAWSELRGDATRDRRECGKRDEERQPASSAERACTVCRKNVKTHHASGDERGGRRCEPARN